MTIYSWINYWFLPEFSRVPLWLKHLAKDKGVSQYHGNGFDTVYGATDSFKNH